jgi:hypothetical protein
LPSTIHSSQLIERALSSEAFRGIERGRPGLLGLPDVEGRGELKPVEVFLAVSPPPFQK